MKLFALAQLGGAVACGQGPGASQQLAEPVVHATEVRLKARTTVTAIKGSVRITRNGEILRPMLGTLIKEGDLVQIGPDSALTLKSKIAVVTLSADQGDWFKFVQ